MDVESLLGLQDKQILITMYLIDYYRHETCTSRRIKSLCKLVSNRKQRPLESPSNIRDLWGTRRKLIIIGSSLVKRTINAIVSHQLAIPIRTCKVSGPSQIFPIATTSSGIE